MDKNSKMCLPEFIFSPYFHVVYFGSLQITIYTHVRSKIIKMVDVPFFYISQHQIYWVLIISSPFEDMSAFYILNYRFGNSVFTGLSP